MNEPIGKEYRIEKSGQHFNLFCDGHHFLTVINQVGTFNVRAHPGEDPNGWGTSVYMQPFFPGARLHSAVIHKIEVTGSGILIIADGKISQGKKNSVGSWHIQITFAFEPESQIVVGSGMYKIDLPSDKEIEGFGDTNVIRIASNYLWDVPLLDGTTGNTGDMEIIEVLYDANQVLWKPSRKHPVLWDQSRSARTVTITTVGGINQFDSVRQGFDPMICPASEKPTVQVKLNALGDTPPLHVFAMMSTYLDKLATDQYDRPVYLYEEYWQDNIGITPIVLAGTDAKQLHYSIEFLSFPPKREK
jgi:hypothetical protein